MGRKRKVVIIIVFIILLATGGFTLYIVNDYDPVNVEFYMTSSEIVQVDEIKLGWYFHGNGNEKAIIFYPGGKVEPESYSPLLYELAENGIDCFLVEMAGNLAFTGMNKADKILQEYNYNEWYMAGHSLGGAMAASYVAEHPDHVKGLILLAAYPTSDLERAVEKEIVIYGSNDQVVNMDKIVAGREYAPENYSEISISGGNHAGFASYGDQAGDGIATITNLEQIDKTVFEILAWLQAE